MSNQAVNSELSFIACGGAGINMAMLLRTSGLSASVSNASYIAIDASGNNRLKPELNIPLFRVPAPKGGTPEEKEAQGSGKVMSANYEEAIPFVDQTLTQNPPKGVVVVLCSGAGGSGSMLALLTVRWLKQHGRKVVVAIITDHTTQVEMENSLKTIHSLLLQTGPDLLNTAIPYMEFRNEAGKTRGQVDRNLVNKISLLSLFATRENEEQDISDLLEILDYSKNYKVAPTLSHIAFYDEPTKFKGKAPVAFLSLYDKRDNITVAFEGAVVRSIGVFSPNTVLPEGVNQMHMLLDHGESVSTLTTQLAELEKRKAATSSAFVSRTVETTSANSNGLIL